MPRIVMQGGNALQGRVDVRGVKNAALPLMDVTLRCDALCAITNRLNPGEIRTLLAVLGAKIWREG